MIDSFTGNYAFLSNFWLCPIEYMGHSFPSTENAYQAAKVPEELRDKKWNKHLTCSPAQSKKLGKQLPLRQDWERIKEVVMYEVCYAKFSDPVLEKLLLDTGDEELIEGNTWGDIEWGRCNGAGQNKLGRILMNIRYRKRLGI